MPISEEMQNRWQLKKCREIKSNVFEAESEAFGPVIVKLGSQTAREYGALCRMGSCRVFAFDEATGALVEERIWPGITLREESCLEKRIEVLRQLFYAIHTPETEGETYLDWVEHACSLPDLPEILAKKRKMTRNICAELFEKYPERMLLHGDLHHDNILLRSDRSYAAIDPKGVVGPEILDLPRFILNEGLDAGHIRHVIGVVAEGFGYPVEDVAKAYYMETVLANLWCAEDGEPFREETLQLAENILEEVYENSESRIC